MSFPGAYRPRASACPGLFRIVPARDGGICRIKIPLGRLSEAQCRAVADAAARFGSGIIEITNRANLQIRGIAPAQTAAVAEALVGAELGPDRPDGDDIRNVMVSPTAGIDAGQVIDTRMLAEALLDRVQGDDSCRALSPKFSFLIDGGEDVAVVDHPHDIWVSSLDSDRLAIGFAGCPPVEAGDGPPAGTIRKDDLGEVIVAAAAVFHEMADGPAITRLRHLFAAGSYDAFLRRLELGPAIVGWRRRPAKSRPVGIFPQRDGLAYVGAIPPLGRLTPEMLLAAAETASRHGVDELRLTPWQGMLLPSVREPDAAIASLERFGFVCDPNTSLAGLIVCAGSPGCASGLADVKADALVLAPMLSRGKRTVHVSGCAKSCASPAAADSTLVAAGSGRYNVYAKSTDAGAGRFGRLLARQVTVGEAGRVLKDIP